MRDRPDDIRSAFALSPEEVLSRVESDAQHGLSADEVNERRAHYGENLLQEAKPKSAWLIFLEQFKSIVIALMAAAAVVALATARLPEGIALVAVTLVNTLIGFISEWKAVRSMESLRELGKQETHVRRDGENLQIPAEDLVPGDVVLIKAEDLAPADIRLLQAEQLRVNEAALTGESVPVYKRTEALEEDTPLAERTNMLYKGTTVAEGSGEGVVVATGMETELGHISKMAQEAESKATPLQQKLDLLGRRMAWITISIAVVVAIAGLLAGRETVLMIETAIALGVAAIPEGLPIVATIALARGMYRMSKRNAVINRLTAVETLGATRVIFSDKTGTLTENKMTVRRAVTAEGDYELDGKNIPGDDARDAKLLKRLVSIGVLCNNASLRNFDEKQSGDPTEIALLEAGVAFGMHRKELLDELPEEREKSFDPDVMMMCTFHRTDDGMITMVKGAPGAVLEACTRIATAEGDEELTEDKRKDWLKRADRLAGKGLRLLAAADRKVNSTEAEPYESLRFLGLIGMVDPPHRAKMCARRSKSASGPESGPSWSPEIGQIRVAPLALRSDWWKAVLRFTAANW